MKKKSFFVPFLIIFIVGAVFAVSNFFNLFQKLDFRLYDSLFHIKKEVPVNQNVTIIKADDPSIEALGEWPWSRDVMGDILIRLKEFDSKVAVFDIEYISPSKKGVAPSAEKKLTEQILAANESINSNLMVLPYAVGQDLDYLTNELILANNDQFSQLIDYVNSNISRDNDEYFARAIQFFGNAWLTLNIRNMGYESSAEEIDYITNRFLFNNVVDRAYLINIDNDYNAELQNEDPGFSPAMYKLISRASNLSFTNSFIDEDGTRRRIELLCAYNNKYIPQLVFGPLVELLNAQEIIRNNNKLIVKNARNPETGTIGDIEIPLDNHGRLLINYTKKGIDESFKTESIYRILMLDDIESQIIPCLNNILNDKQIFDDNNDLLPYFMEAYNLYNEYLLINETKNQLLNKCDGFDKYNNPINTIADDEYASYYNLRKQFFDLFGKFVNQKHINQILARIQELQSAGLWDGTDQDIEYFNQDFEDIGGIYNEYTTLFTELNSKLKNSYCILGHTATSTSDLGATPLIKKYENVGIHANVMNTILTKNFIYYYDWYWGFLAAFVLLIISLLIGAKNNVLQNIMNALAVVISIAVFVILFLFFNIYVPFIGTVLYLIVAFISLILYRYFISSKEKKFITQVASSFANKDTVEELRKNPDAFNAKGVKRPITALFSDVQSFSTLSEKISKIYGDEGPDKLIGILNEYLGKMSNEILANNGTIDKYEGDAIISMFGAPDPSNSHTKEEWAYLTLDSAIRMKKVEVEFNEQHKELFNPVEIINSNGKKETISLSPLKTRIGINSGNAFVGMMGSKTEQFSKLNYTMIGDTVNLASRLEGVNKPYKSWIMCSGETWNLANTGINKDKILARCLDQVRVVGRNTPVAIYNVLGFKDDFTPLQREQLDIFNAAMEEYLNSNFRKAGQLFVQAATINGLEDPTSLVFAERCKNFIEKGVPKDWDFIINMTSK